MRSFADSMAAAHDTQRAAVPGTTRAARHGLIVQGGELHVRHRGAAGERL